MLWAEKERESEEGPRKALTEEVILEVDSDGWEKCLIDMGGGQAQWQPELYLGENLPCQCVAVYS